MTTTRLSPPAPVTARRAVSFEPTSFNASDNTIDVVWTTGAAVLRSDWITSEYYSEVLSTNPAHVRLGRLNAGAPFLDSHQEGNLGAVLGSIVPGTARVAGGIGTCRVRLAETPDVADTIAKIKAGHIRHTSVGYAVYAFERTERPGETPIMTAVDWEPREISAVNVPADAGCQIRSEPTMTDTITDTDAPEVATRASRRGVTAQRISDLCRRSGAGIDGELALLRSHAVNPLTEDQLLTEITRMYAEANNPPEIDNTSATPGLSATGRGSPEDLRRRMGGAVQARLTGAAPPAESREFMGATMIDMVRGLLIARGERAQYLSPAAVFERSAGMTTSDFPILLAGPVGAYLNELFTAAPPVLQTIARHRKTRDFKPIAGLRLEGSGSLDYLPENGAYAYAAFDESGQQYQVNTFGKLFALSRQAIINDNLGAYAQMAAQFVRRAAAKRAEILAALINANTPIRTLGSAPLVPLFDVSHGNVASTGAELSIASLSAARLAMRAQKDSSGTILDVAPRYLVVGPELETKAEQVLTELAAVATSDGVNPFAGKLILLVEPRLIGRAWYLFADPSAYPVLEYATLEGEDEVFTDTRLNWNPDQVETKVRIDFGAAAIDYRGGYKNPGT